VVRRERSVIGRAGGIALAVAAIGLVGLIQPAAAQSLFEALFGGFQRPAPPRTSSYAEPFGPPVRESRWGEANNYGTGTVFCVRTCDGRYFPLRNHAGASPAEMCRAFCPAAKTMVFSGSKIDYAVAPNGTHYADLDSAFAYRDRVVSNCTCNGKDGLGLARLDAASDPTLRPGDIVATDNGFVSVSRSGKSTEFTPINPASSEWAHKLSEIKIRPAPPLHPVTPVADNDSKPKLKGRLQASR
jgi:hypothetical protein